MYPDTNKNNPDDRSILILRAAIVAMLILLAAALRVVPHPWNVTPIGAIAIFSGSLIRNRWAAVLLPLATLFAGDLFIGFHKLMLVVYASFLCSVLIGRALARHRTIARIGGAAFLGALQFFLVTNFAMWAVAGFYPRTAAGLAACFTAAIPFFGNTLAGDAFYSVVLFGGYALAESLLGVAGHSIDPQRSSARSKPN